MADYSFLIEPGKRVNILTLGDNRRLAGVIRSVNHEHRHVTVDLEGAEAGKVGTYGFNELRDLDPPGVI